MVIETDNKRVQENRRLNLQLLLSQHYVNCPSCERSGNCELQRLSQIYTVGDEVERFWEDLPNNEWDQDSPLIRDEDKCIRCYRCVAVCEKIQSVNIWDMVGSGSHTTVGVSGDRKRRISFPWDALQVKGSAKIYDARPAVILLRPVFRPNPIRDHRCALPSFISSQFIPPG